MAPMTALRDCLDPEILLVEDAAQSQGAVQHGPPAGSVGAAAGTSFYPGKNLGAYGDAGAVLTSSDEVAERVRSIRNHGGVRRYEHTEIGCNSRLDSLQAAVLTAKLLVSGMWNRERVDAAAYYDELVKELPSVVCPTVVSGNEHVWHLYVIRVPDRDRVLAELNALRIGAGIHYPTPIHLTPAFAYLGRPEGSFPNSESYGKSILSLPIYPGITKVQQERIVQALKQSLSL